MNIHQKINARSWYQGNIHPTDLMSIGTKHGVEHYTPTRIRIHAPYKVKGLWTEKPRHKGNFYLIVDNVSVTGY